MAERRFIADVGIQATELKNQVNKINEELRRINNGEKEINIKVNLGDLAANMFSELSKSVEKAGGDFDKLNKVLKSIQDNAKKAATSVRSVSKSSGLDLTRHSTITGAKGTTDKKVYTDPKTGLSTTRKEKPSGKVEYSQEHINRLKEFNAKLNTIINTYGKLTPAKRANANEIQNVINKLTKLSHGYGIESDQLKKIHTEKQKYINLYNKATGSTNNFNNSLNKIWNSWYKLSEVQRSNIPTLQNYIAKLRKIGANYGENDSRLKTVNATIETFKNKITKIKNSTEGLTKHLTKQNNAFATLTSSLQRNPEVLKRIIAELERMKAGYNLNSSALAKINNQQQRYKKILNNTIPKINETDRTIRKINNSYLKLDVTERRKVTNLKAITNVLEVMRRKYTETDVEMTKINRAHERYSSILRSVLDPQKALGREINKINNAYLTLPKSLQNTTSAIKFVITELDKLTVGHKLESAQLKTINVQRDKYINRLNRVTAETQSFNAKLNTIINTYEMLDAVKKRDIDRVRQTITQLSELQKHYQAHQREFTVINNKKQKYIQLERQLYEAHKLSDRALKESINNYNQLTAAQQRSPAQMQKIITQYDKLIAKYREEKKAVDGLIKQRSVWKQKTVSSVNSAKEAYNKLLLQYKVTNKEMFKLSGAMGSGDARSTLGDKLYNSLIYTTSALTYGMTLKAMRDLVNVNKEYELGLIDLSRTMNTYTIQDIDELGKKAVDLGRKFGVSLKEVQDAMTQIARAGIDNKDQIGDLSESVMLGLNTTEIDDANEMVGYLVSTIKQLDLEFENSAEIIDKWNMLADRYAVRAHDFAEAITKAGSAGKMLGLDLDTINAMITVLGERTQAAGKEIGNAMRTLASFITRPKTIKTLKEYGIEVKKNANEFHDFQDIMKNVNETIDGFGENSVKSVEILNALGGAWRRNWISILASDWAEIDGIVVEQAEALGYSAKENEKVMETLDAQIRVLKATFTELALAFGEAGLTDFIKMVVSAMTGLVDMANNVNDNFASMILTFVGVGTALKLLNRAIMGMTGFNVLTRSMSRLIVTYGQGAYASQGLAASQKILDQAMASGTLSIAKNKAMGKALAMNRKITKVNTAEAAVQEHAYTAALNTTLITSKKAAAAKAAATFGITAAISAVVYWIWKWIDAEKEQRRQAMDDARYYGTQIETLENYNRQLLDNSTAVEKTTNAKETLIQIEEKLKEVYENSNREISIQNEKLSEKLSLIKEIKIEEAKEFIRKQGSEAREAQDELESSYETFWRLSTRYRQSKAGDVRSDSEIGKIIESLGGELASTTHRRSSIAHEFKIDTPGASKLERYEKLGEMLDVLEEKYRDLSKQTGVSEEKLENYNYVISVMSKEYNKLDDSLTDLIDLSAEYEAAMEVIKEEEAGSQFIKDYQNQIDTLGVLFKRLQKTEHTGHRETLINSIKEYKEELEQAAEGNEAHEAFVDELFEKFSDSVDHSRDSIISLNEEIDVLSKPLDKIRNGVTLFNKALNKMKDGEFISTSELRALIELYPQLQGQMEETVHGWRMQEDALRNVRNSYIDLEMSLVESTYAITSAMLENSKIEINALSEKTIAFEKIEDANWRSQQGMSATTYENIKDRMTNYMKEIESINDVTNAYLDAQEQMAKDELFLSIGEDSSPIFYPNELAAFQAKMDLIERLRTTADINDLRDLLKHPSDYYQGLEPDPDEGGGGTSKDKAKKDPAEAIMVDRYLELNAALEKVNSALATNASIQENIDGTERVKYLKEEISLLEAKQNALHNIANENRKERSELADYLRTVGGEFQGSGDTLEITNAESLLESKAKQVNKHRHDEDRTVYNKLKSEYDLLETNLTRFINIQKTELPALSSEWWELKKSISDTGEEITSTRVESVFKAIKEYGEEYNTLMSDLEFKEKLYADSVAQSTSVRNEMYKLATASLMTYSTRLKELNKHTDESITKDEEYIEKKREIVEQIQSLILFIKDLNNTTAESQEEVLDNTLSRIIDIIKKGVELQKESLNEQLNDYRDHVNDILEERNRLHEEEDFEKALAKDQESLMDIQEQINRLAHDTSIEGMQRKAELEEQYAEEHEAMEERKLQRSRKLEEQSLRDSVKIKEEATQEALDMLDEVFSEENIKVMAREVLLEKSFDSIKDKIPELFNVLNVETDNFFEVFEKHEEKFGSIIGDFAKKFKDEILPEIMEAVDLIDDAEERAAKARLGELQRKWYATDDQDERDAYHEEGQAIRDKYGWEWEDYRDYDPNEDYYSSDVSSGDTDSDFSDDLSQEILEDLGIGDIDTSSAEELIKKFLEAEKDKERLGELQTKWYATDDQEKRDAYHEEGKAIRAKHGWEWQDYRDYTSPYADAFSGGINKGLVKETGSYLLHGSDNNPEWVLTNQQMFNLVKGLSNNLSMSVPTNSSNNTPVGDINLSINVNGNADANTVKSIKNVGKEVLLDIKRSLNKQGIYR